MRLPIHLENQQHVRWSDQRSIPEVVRDGTPDTPLTAWFKSNTKPEHQFGKHLLYSDYAELCTCHGQSKEWKVRKRGVDTLLAVCTLSCPMQASYIFFLFC